MTQQELANETGLSLRTVQRIEKGDQELSGYSLKQVSRVLNIPLEHLIMSNVSHLKIETSSLGAVKALYLSSLLFVINPVLGIIVPAILGYLRPDRDAFYKKHFRFVLIYFVAVNVFVYGFILLLAIDKIVLRTGVSSALFEMVFRHLIPLSLLYYLGTIAVMLYRFFSVKNPPGEVAQYSPVPTESPGDFRG